MANVLLAHSNPNFRISLARELEGRGFQVAGYADIEGALDAVATEAYVALLVEPALLIAEEFELGARLEVRAGRMLPILALAHKATTQEMSVFRRHSAGLLARPIEDLDRLARQLTNLAESAPPAPAKAPWDAQGGTAEAAKPARPSPTGGIVETVGTGRRRRKRGNTDVTSDDTATSAQPMEPERPPTPTSYATPAPAPVPVAVPVPVPAPASPPAPDLFETGAPGDTETVVSESSPAETPAPPPPAYATAPPPSPPPALPSAPAPESSPLDAILARPPFPDEGAEALSTSILPPDALGPEPVIPPPPPRAPLPPVEIPPPSPDWTPPPAARSGDPAADVMPTGRTDAFFARSIEVDRAVPIGGSEDPALEDDVDAPAPPTDEMPVEDFYAPVERPAVVSPPAWETRVDPPADAATRVESEPEEAEPPADGGGDADAGADVAYFDTFVTPNDMPLLEGSFRAPVSRPPSPPAADLDGADPSDAIADGGGTVVSTPFEADDADAMPEQTPIDEIDGPSPADDGAAPPATAIESDAGAAAGEGDHDAARALEEELFGDGAGPQTTIAELPEETGARASVPSPADPSAEESAEASVPPEREKPRDRKSRKEKKKDKRAKKDEAKRAKKSKEKDRDREKERPKAPPTPMPAGRASENGEPSPSRPSGRAAVVRVVIEDTDPRDALSAAREDAAARDGWEIERNAHDGVEGVEDAEDAGATEEGDVDRSGPAEASGVLAREAPDDDRTQTSAPGRAPAEPSGVLAREAPDEDRTETRAPPVAPSRGGVVAREAPEEEGTIRSPGPRGGTSPAEQLDGTLVLVVDDEPAFRGFLRDALVSQGYRVHTAINAPNALRFLKANNHVDLVISDLNMPHMDGFELKHEIDQWVARKLPFIVVTADPSDEKIEIAAQVGASALVPKPIDDLDAFYSIVAETLRDAGIDVPEPPPAAKK